MTEDLRIVGVPADQGRPEVTPGDRVRLAESIAAAGFALCNGPPNPHWQPTNIIGPAEAGAAGSLWVANDTLEACVGLDDDWVLHVSVPLTLVDVERDADLGAKGLRTLVSLIGAAADVADPYVAFFADGGDDLSAIAGERPFAVEEPFALLYLEPRYLEDNGIPDFAAEAAIHAPAGAGRVIIMDPVELS